VVTTADIEKQGWSLNPGRYAGVQPHRINDVEFWPRIRGLSDEWVRLTTEADGLSRRVTEVITRVLDE
jgi:type I restriction enzyme M protein